MILYENNVLKYEYNYGELASTKSNQINNKLLFSYTSKIVISLANQG